ncbi:hypothetical protein [Siphonobacter aquaeclarae]|uniref:Uncharacterized protein n=1 Tax=Siphonobacter aquaeclarae TaxID=563176 RepID=A0A1G9PU88_9BACT|nr:hypothetical protein [Siphonobacter aquaeclarae]SDM01685.1 hypothetical protein SAMN04488090_2299 [Siphonobacter aquaeclarae]
MKKSYLFLSLAAAFVACDKENTPQPVEEYAFVRLLVNDEQTNKLTLLSPSSGKTETFEAAFPKAALYTTESGRYAALVHTSSNKVTTFDSGLELHGDHVDVKGIAKFGILTAESAKPTHFKSQGGELITFNDGDGTMSVAPEADIHAPGAVFRSLSTGNKAHHGAMARFSNGTYAVTEKDGTVSGSLPERVRIIDATGKTVHASTLATGGIHGNASDGNVAVFGSTGGVLVVEASGQQRLIPYPAAFGTAWLSTIYEAKGTFVGYSSAVGAYEIDLKNNAIRPLLENKELLLTKIDVSKKYLLGLTYGGVLKVVNLASRSLLREGSVIPAVSKEETQKPALAATSRFAYITQPKQGKVLRISLENLSDSRSFAVSPTPYQLTVLGYETDESH